MVVVPLTAHVDASKASSANWPAWLASPSPTLSAHHDMIHKGVTPCTPPLGTRPALQTPLLEDASKRSPDQWPPHTGPADHISCTIVLQNA